MIFIYQKQKFLNFSSKYHGEQRVHQGEVPRLGGLMIFVTLICFYQFTEESSGLNYRYLLYLILPFMLASFYEDILHNQNFKIRLILMILTALMINIYLIEVFPLVENIPLLSNLLKSPVFATLFFSFALIGVMNGANFIDGMNGLATLFFLGALCGCVTLSFVVGDLQSILVLIPWIILMTCFLIFNYPYGKLFLGDSGAYLMAILISVWLIDFFSRHQQISSWNAVLILIYPLLEVVYSVIRKIYQGKSPFFPDREHLHIKVFDMINAATKKPFYANNITTVFLAVLWLSPALAVQFVYNSQIGISICIVIMIVSYILLNTFTPALGSQVVQVKRVKK